MQSDRYMRIVLTVIAVCLVWICLRDVVVVKPALAQFSGTNVYVDNWPYTQKVEVTNWPILQDVNVLNSWRPK